MLCPPLLLPLPLAAAASTAAGCRKRHECIAELREKLARLEASAGLAEKREMYEAASVWAMVREREETLAAAKHKLEVGALAAGVDVVVRAGWRRGPAAPRYTSATAAAMPEPACVCA